MPKNKTHPLPFYFYFIPVCLLVLSGLIVSIYLSISHYRIYTDIGYSSFCAISKAINCDTVSQSSYSILWGLPVPIWGVIGYAFLLLLLSYAFNKTNGRKHGWALFFTILAGYSLFSLYLAAVSSFFIHSYCTMCILSYGINFALLFYSWIILRRFNSEGWIDGLIYDFDYMQTKVKTILPLLVIFLVSTFILYLSIDRYWDLNIQPAPTDIQKGVTKDGHPWIGAEEPELVITEYTDYLCFQCKKMHFLLRSLVANNKSKIRLVHLHFPIDKKYNSILKEDLHHGAGDMALLAIYAGLKEKFWEMNDFLYQIDHSKGSIRLDDISKKTKIDIRELSWALTSKDIRLRLKKDIAYGIMAGVVGTPSYVINGKTYQGNIPSDILKPYLKITGE